MDNCIFCKIAAGDVPSYTVYKDDHYLAFLDQSPLGRGHTLVIPRKHYQYVWDLPENTTPSPNIGQYFATCKKIARRMQEIFDTELIASAVLGEAVPHAHIHLLPDIDNFFSAWASAPTYQYDEGEHEEIVQRFNAA